MKPRRLSWFSRPPRWARFVLYAVAIGFIVWAWIPNWSDLSSSEAPVIIKKPGEPDSYNVTVGDVVVNLLGSAPRDHRPHADYLRIAVERDPRFHFARSLDALLVYLSESPDIPRQISRYEELLKGAEPQPALYPAAPPNSTVFSPGDLRDSAEVIRLDGTLFFRRTPYWVCLHFPLQPGPHGHRCHILTQLTEKTSVEIVLFDGDYQPDEWRQLLQAIESGIREMISNRVP